MRILTYVPLNPTQPRLHPLTAACIDNLSWSQSMPIVFGRNDTPNKRGKYADIVDKHNEARRMVLDGDYDALFLVEADMVIPPDALQRLVHDCGLVCGHIDGGNVLWPDPDAKELVRREKL